MSNNTTIQQAQEQVDQWIKTVGVKYFSELTNLGILMEEVGSSQESWSGNMEISPLKTRKKNYY